MGCPDHGNWKLIDGILRCPKCDRISSHQPLPPYDKLLKEKEALVRRVSDLELFLDDYISGCADNEDYLRTAVRLLKDSQDTTRSP